MKRKEKLILQYCERVLVRRKSRVLTYQASKQVTLRAYLFAVRVRFGLWYNSCKQEVYGILPVCKRVPV
jgi:hypothetical protein